MGSPEKMPIEMLERVAGLFKVLGDPSRLEILQLLMLGAKSVSEIVDVSGKGQANVSKHLSVLAGAGIVSRTPRGTQAIYEVVDPLVYGLCEMVCSSVRRRVSHELQEGQRLLKRK